MPASSRWPAPRIDEAIASGAAPHRRAEHAHLLLLPGGRDAGPLRLVRRQPPDRRLGPGGPRQPGRGLRHVAPGSRCSTWACPATTPRSCRAARSAARRSACWTTRARTRPRSTAWSSGPGRCCPATRAATSTTRPTTSVATTSTPPTCGCSPSRWPIGSGRSGPRGWPPRSAWSRWSARPTARRSVGAGRRACCRPRSPSSWPRWPSPVATPIGPGSGCAGPPTRPPTSTRGSATGSSPPTSTSRPMSTAARSGACSSRSTSSGKLAWAAKELARVDPHARGRPTPPMPIPWQDELVRFEDERAAAVWAHRSPGAELVIPFVGATRSDYLPAPHLRGLFEVPVDEGLVVLGADGQRPPPHLDRRRRSRPRSWPTTAGSRARWDSLVLRGELDPPGEVMPEGEHPACACRRRAAPPGRSRGARSASTSSSSWLPRTAPTRSRCSSPRPRAARCG